MSSAFVTAALPCASKSVVQRHAVTMVAERPQGSITRRSLFNAAAALALSAAVAPVAPSLADGAVSSATKTRARGLYGSRILALNSSLEDLKAAVEQGNWVVVETLVKSDKKRPGVFVSEKNAFALFASGTYPGDRQTLSALEDEASIMYGGLKKLEKSAKDFDKKGAETGLKAVNAGYKGYLQVAKLTVNEFTEEESGQVWSTDFDFRRSFSRKQIIN